MGIFASVYRAVKSYVSKKSTSSSSQKSSGSVSNAPGGTQKAVKAITAHATAVTKSYSQTKNASQASQAGAKALSSQGYSVKTKSSSSGGGSGGGGGSKKTQISPEQKTEITVKTSQAVIQANEQRVQTAEGKARQKAQEYNTVIERYKNPVAGIGPYTYVVPEKDQAKVQQKYTEAVQARQEYEQEYNRYEKTYDLQTSIMQTAQINYLQTTAKKATEKRMTDFISSGKLPEPPSFIPSKKKFGGGSFEGVGAGGKWNVAESPVEDMVKNRARVATSKARQSGAFAAMLPEKVVYSYMEANEQMRYYTSDVAGMLAKRYTKKSIPELSTEWGEYAASKTPAGLLASKAFGKEKVAASMAGFYEGVILEVKDKPLKNALIFTLAPGASRLAGAGASLLKTKAIVGGYKVAGVVGAQVARWSANIAGGAGVTYLGYKSVVEPVMRAEGAREKGKVVGGLTVNVGAALAGNLLYNPARVSSFLKRPQQLAAIGEMRRVPRLDPKLANPQNIAAYDEMAAYITKVTADPASFTIAPKGEPDLSRAFTNPKEAQKFLQTLRETGDTLGGSAGQSAFYDEQTRKYWLEVKPNQQGVQMFTGKLRQPRDVDIVARDFGKYQQYSSSTGLDLKSPYMQRMSSPFASEPVQTPSGINVYSLGEQLGRKGQGMSSYQWETSPTLWTRMKNIVVPQEGYMPYRATKDFYGNIPNLAAYGKESGKIPLKSVKSLITDLPKLQVYTGTQSILAQNPSLITSLVYAGGVSGTALISNLSKISLRGPSSFPSFSNSASTPQPSYSKLSKLKSPSKSMLSKSPSLTSKSVSPLKSSSPSKISKLSSPGSSMKPSVSFSSLSKSPYSKSVSPSLTQMPYRQREIPGFSFKFKLALMDSVGKMKRTYRPTRYDPSLVGVVYKKKRRKDLDFLTGIEVRGL